MVNACAGPGRRPQVVDLAAEDRWREVPVTVDRRSLPEQQALDRQRRVPLVLMRTGGVAEAVPGALERFHVARRELAPWIREVHYRLAGVLRDGLLRFPQLVEHGADRFRRQRNVAAGVGADG